MPFSKEDVNSIASRVSNQTMQLAERLFLNSEGDGASHVISALKVTYIHEYCIQRGHNFLHATVIDISHCKRINITFLAADFLQTVVFSQRDGDFIGMYINNQFAFHVFSTSIGCVGLFPSGISAPYLLCNALLPLKQGIQCKADVIYLCL